jgi:hypothetical protein
MALVAAERPNVKTERFKLIEMFSIYLSMLAVVCLRGTATLEIYP